MEVVPQEGLVALALAEGCAGVAVVMRAAAVGEARDERDALRNGRREFALDVAAVVAVVAGAVEAVGGRREAGPDRAAGVDAAAVAGGRCPANA